MGYYNARITGHPLRMPFMEYSAQYDIYPKFWFLPKHPPPTYSSTPLRKYTQTSSPAITISSNPRRRPASPPSDSGNFSPCTPAHGCFCYYPWQQPPLCCATLK